MSISKHLYLPSQGAQPPLPLSRRLLNAELSDDAEPILVVDKSNSREERSTKHTASVIASSSQAHNKVGARKRQTSPDNARLSKTERLSNRHFEIDACLCRKSKSVSGSIRLRFQTAFTQRCVRLNLLNDMYNWYFSFNMLLFPGERRKAGTTTAPSRCHRQASNGVLHPTARAAPFRQGGEPST